MKFKLILSLLMISSYAQAQSLGVKGAERGEAAIKKHAARLDKIAAKYKMPREKFEKGLRQDKSLYLDEKGDLFVSENMLPDILGDEVAQLNPTAAMIPDASALSLHSRPGAARKILLDFTGHAVSNTSWNSGGTINAEPYNIDGNPGFSAEELSRIKETWLRVAEDYAPFDVDVTTEDVASEAELNGASGGIRVLITPTSNWYPAGAGGVAYIGSYTFRNSTPVWVFADRLANLPQYIAECSSHESGHSLGLHHQSILSGGTVTQTYNPGKGSGDYSWAPIMGNSYGKRNTLWHNGLTPFNSPQDAIATIAGYLPVLPDDVQDSLSSTSLVVKSQLANSIQQFKHQASVTKRGDKDIFKLRVGNGPLDLNISSAITAPNLDLKVILRSPSGSILQVMDPPGSAQININLADVSEGEYSLEISPVGYTDPNGVLIYDDYGLRGRYYITGSADAHSGVITDVDPVDPPITPVDPPVVVVNQAPDVSAGIDRSLTLPSSSLVLSGSASDADGFISQVSWSQVAGPSAAALSGASSLNLTASGLIAGSYTFRLMAIDNSGAISTDDVVVSVKAATIKPVRCKGKGCR